MFCPSCRGEFREGFTWCRDCEVSLVESLPDEPEESCEPAAFEEKEDWDEPAEDVETRASEADPDKLLRSRELLLVLFVCFGTSIALSIYDLFQGERSTYTPTSSASLSTIVDSLAAIALLAYVLSRRRRTLRHLGVTFERADILPTVLLTAASFLPWLLTLIFGFGLTDARSLFDATLTFYGFLTFGLLQWGDFLLNAAGEELVVRAYMITEVTELTGNKVLAVLASTCFQATYHLYQGAPGALSVAGMFLIFSIYYARSRRATPVVLAHFLHSLLL